MPDEHRPLGVVTRLFNYPVKSMRGTTIPAAKLGWHGLAGDRRFAFTRTGNGSGLPWLSAREMPRLILYEARFTDPAQPDRSPIIVAAPGGGEHALDSPELLHELEELYGGRLNLMQVWRGTFDSMALSLISENAIDSFSGTIGRPLEMERFRPNLVVRALEPKPYPEDHWVGELLVFGDRPDSARIRVNRKDPRCTIINLDPTTAESCPDLLIEVVKGRKNLLGVYGSTERPGTIQVGDTVCMVKT